MTRTPADTAAGRPVDQGVGNQPRQRCAPRCGSELGAHVEHSSAGGGSNCEAGAAHIAAALTVDRMTVVGMTVFGRGRGRSGGASEGHRPTRTDPGPVMITA
jgi:hypothetical protein